MKNSFHLKRGAKGSLSYTRIIFTDHDLVQHVRDHGPQYNYMQCTWSTGHGPRSKYVVHGPILITGRSSVLLPR